jgi:hypothetical protein
MGADFDKFFAVTEALLHAAVKTACIHDRKSAWRVFLPQHVQGQ